MELLSPGMKNLWIEWQLRAMVLLSLTLQIILILLGNRRKHIYKNWIKIIVWPAYLTADFVATGALGVLVSNLFRCAGTLDPKLELQAFWAPFLLLHLGGPDTITAYSFEDNELWKRNLLELIVQAGFAFYILLMAWTGSHISILAMPMMLAGLIKYGERTWVRWSASSSKQRRSLKPISQNMVQALSDGEDHADDKLLQVAHWMFNMAKHIFAGVPPTTIERSVWANHQKPTFDSGKKISPKKVSSSQKLFINYLKNMSPGNVFEVIEMQLGFMYDFLYTKALVTYTPRGIALRFTSFLLTIIVLVLFSSAPHNTQRYSKPDLYITFLLLAVAILLELYAALLLLLSDRTLVWLRKHKRNNISQAITSLSLPRNPRWSNSMGQFSLLSYFINEKPMVFYGILKLEKQRYVAYHQVSEDLKIWLISRSRTYRMLLEADPSYETQKVILKNFGAFVTLGYLGYDPSSILFSVTRMDVQQATLVWHIATELCYVLDRDYFTRIRRSSITVALNRKMSQHISRYMMYLLAISPDSLPGIEGIGLRNLPGSEGIGPENFQRTCDEARNALKHKYDEASNSLQRLVIEKKGKEDVKIQASTWLLMQYSDIKNGQLSGSLLSYGCAVAQALMKDEQRGEGGTQEEGRRIEVLIEEEKEKAKKEHMSKKWETLAGVWLELLIKAGRQCIGSQHAQHLGQGGEFLTHFWLFFFEFEYLDQLVTETTGESPTDDIV